MGALLRDLGADPTRDPRRGVGDPDLTRVEPVTELRGDAVGVIERVADRAECGGTQPVVVESHGRFGEKDRDPARPVI